MVKSKNTPKLRFPEFSDEWEEKKLNELVKIESSKYNPKNNNEYFPCVELENLSQISGKLLGYHNSKDQLSIKNFFKKGEILFGKLRPYLKKYWLADFNGVCSTEIWVLNGKYNSNKFIYQLIQTNRFDYISNVSSGSKMPRADWKFMRQIKFKIPSIKEQGKIANFLTKVDEKIDLLESRLVYFENFKKFCMQQLFAQKLRFTKENGENYLDWREEFLGNMCSITTGKLDANNMVKEGKYKFFTCAKEVFNIDDYAFDTEALLISGNGAHVGYIHYYNGKFNAYQRTYVLNNFRENIIFIKFYLDNFLKKRIMMEKNEGSTPYIKLNTLSKMKIYLPNLKEQEKIAKFLTDIDKKIENINYQLDQTKEFKKGLLQQMFI